MADTTIKKVEAGSSPRGEMGQKYLVAGKRVSMRLWIDEPGGKLKAPTTRDYETVGYVISGSAKLDQLTITGKDPRLARSDRSNMSPGLCPPTSEVQNENHNSINENHNSIIVSVGFGRGRRSRSLRQDRTSGLCSP
jgi:hypothetical protein